MDVDGVAVGVDVALVVMLAGAIQPAAALRHVVPADAEDLARRRDEHGADLAPQRARRQRRRERVEHELFVAARRLAEVP